MLHVFVEGKLDPTTGFVMDYASISKAVKPLIEKLDHHHLGAWEVWNNGVCHHIGGRKLWGVEGLPLWFYPSSENLLYWIGQQLSIALVDWSKVALEETCTSYAELTKDEYMKTAFEEEGVVIGVGRTD